MSIARKESPAKPPSITFDITADKKIRIALVNVLYVLEQHPAWGKQSLGFDELLGDVVLLQRPPYLPDTGPWRIRPITEQDYRETANWLQRTYKLYAGSTLAGEGLTTYAYRFPFHAIRTYLDGLKWDSQPRIDYWLKRYCHAPENPFTMAVASKTLIAAVARVYDPGCKVDTMTILEGEQGDLKSTVWNTFAGNAWFSDSLPDLHDKDAAQALCGKWFVEFAELAHFQRNEIETVKRFLSAKADHYRPSYGKKAATFPRQNIFVGSTNEEHYFKDHTGNRRFWPVKVHGICDIASLERDRDQLWAEAVVRYRHGERWHLSPELEKLARQEQAQRAELDDWEAGVLEYSEKNSRESSDKSVRYVTTETILNDHLQVENKLHHTQAHTKRLGGILRRNGWKSQQVRAIPGAKQFWAWVQPPPLPPQGPVMSVTSGNEKNPPTHHSPSASNDAAIGSPVMPVIGVMGECAHTQDALRLSALQEVPITGITAITPITGTDSPATNGSVLGGATFPPGRLSQDEAGEVLSRAHSDVSEAPERPLTGSPSEYPPPSPGGKGAAGACALADGEEQPPKFCRGCGADNTERTRTTWLDRPTYWECCKRSCGHRVRKGG